MLPDPMPREAAAIVREEGRVVLEHDVLRQRFQRHNRWRDRHAGTRGALVAHVVPCQCEAALAVVVLLRHHAIQPDDAALESPHRRVPKR